MRPFVVLQHKMPQDVGRNDHWDLMLKSGSILETWALDELPAQEMICVGLRLADHDQKYLNYEGPISSNRGSVKRVLSGQYRWVIYDEVSQCTAQLFLDSQCWTMTMGPLHDGRREFRFT